MTSGGTWFPGSSSASSTSWEGSPSVFSRLHGLGVNGALVSSSESGVWDCSWPHLLLLDPSPRLLLVLTCFPEPLLTLLYVLNVLNDEESYNINVQEPGKRFIPFFDM